MRVAFSLADVIIDTTEMHRAGIATRCNDEMTTSEQNALHHALHDVSEMSLSGGNFFNVELITKLAGVFNTSYIILCKPSERELGYRVAELLQEHFGLLISDVYSDCFMNMRDYIIDTDIDLVVTNDMCLVSTAEECPCSILGYGMYNTHLPIPFTRDVDQIVWNLGSF